MKKYIASLTALACIVSASVSVAAENSTHFKEEAIPTNDVGDFGLKSSHRYGDHKFGYFHLFKSGDGKNQWAQIEFSDGSRADNQFYASLVCKDTSGNVIDVLNFNRKLGMSIKTMEHKYSFRVTCPGKWAVNWGKVRTNFDPKELVREGTFAAITIWIGA